MPSQKTIQEYKQAVHKRRSKKFNDWKYLSKNELGGKLSYKNKDN